MSKQQQKPNDAADIEQAKRNASVARARVQTTVGALKERLNPRNIANDAKERVREKTGAITERATTVVQRRPMAASAAAGVATLVILRKPVKKLARRLFRRKRDEQDEGDVGKDEGLIRAGAPPKPSITPRIERAVVESNATALNKQE